MMGKELTTEKVLRTAAIASSVAQSQTLTNG